MLLKFPFKVLLSVSLALLILLLPLRGTAFVRPAARALTSAALPSSAPPLPATYTFDSGFLAFFSQLPPPPAPAIPPAPAAVPPPPPVIITGRYLLVGTSLQKQKRLFLIKDVQSGFIIHLYLNETAGDLYLYSENSSYYIKNRVSSEVFRL